MAQQTIILIGMSGVGKSYLGRYASDILGVPFFDTDEIIKDKYMMELRDLVKMRSWTWFRHEEHVVLEELISASSDAESCRIISTGGGIIENPLVFPLLGKGQVVYIKRDVSEAIKAGRCLSKSYDELLNDRQDVYERLADFVYVNNSDRQTFLEFIHGIIMYHSD